MQSTTLSKETKGQGIVQENFTPGQGIIFGNLTPRQGSFLDFPAARPRMFVGQVPPPGTHISDCLSCVSKGTFCKTKDSGLRRDKVMCLSEE